MKKSKGNQAVQQNYAAPQIEVITLENEKGFATSAVLPDWVEGEKDFFN